MIEHGLAGNRIWRYLVATRGAGAEYLRYPINDLTRFFGDCLESFRMSGIPLRNVKLTIVDSHQLDVETIVADDGAHIVFDQSLIDVLAMMTPLVLDHVSAGPGWSFPPDATGPAWMHAHYANRYLAAGMEHESIIQAHLTRGARALERGHETSLTTVSRWVRAQCAFTVAHELGHCQVADGGTILARGIAQSFEEDMLPYVRMMDEVDPTPYEPPSRFPEVERQLKQTMSELGISSNLPQWRALTREERLDWIVSDDTGLGEEVLADFQALSLTARLIAGDEYEFDDCLAACVSSLQHLFLIRQVETTAASFSGRELDSIAMDRMLREFDIRTEFIRYSAAIMSRNQHGRDCHARGVTNDVYDVTFAARGEMLVSRITKVTDAWQALLRPILVSRQASRTEEMKQHFLKHKGNEMFEFVHTKRLPSLIASMTGIGPE